MSEEQFEVKFFKCELEDYHTGQVENLQDLQIGDSQMIVRNYIALVTSATDAKFRHYYLVPHFKQHKHSKFEEPQLWRLIQHLSMIGDEWFDENNNNNHTYTITATGETMTTDDYYATFGQYC